MLESDPSPATSFPVPSGGTTPRTVTLQVVCAKGLVPESSPHKTVFLKSGQTKTASATCAKGQVLMGGGFQRTNFVRFGGDYITESRAVGSRTWRVSGTAFGSFGGELSAIAYCVRSKKPLLTTVTSPTVPVGDKQLAKTVTPACAKGSKLTSGGFSLQRLLQRSVRRRDPDQAGTWSASAFGYFGGGAQLTAYGYCLRPGVTP